MSTPEEAAAILNDPSPRTAEQIAQRIIECFEAGQRRSDGSMALHPSRERWYIADAYRLAKIVLGDSGRGGWVCVRHRCEKHYDVPAQNTNEASGSECGGCIAAERDRLAFELGGVKAELGITRRLLRRMWSIVSDAEDEEIAQEVCGYLAGLPTEEA